MTLRGVQLFDSVSKTFKSVPRDGVLSWYSCGPTVYDKTHLGHARNYVQVDVMQRLLERLGHSVHHVMGVTDVDDKIIAKAALSRSQPIAVARHFEADFRRAMEKMGVRPPLTLTRVTEHMDGIFAYIEKILENGFAYITDQGVYFDTGQMGPSYHALGGGENAVSEEPSEAGKRRAGDFALWKFRLEGTDFGWSSPWGFGRPGWHIECSAMIEDAFGPREFLDIHSGGVDLCFPHHNNEIAQSCARYGGKSASALFGTFVHVGHLHIEGRKMSKSLKNFITVDELPNDKIEAFRMFCLLHHYRSNTNYSEIKLNEAQSVLTRLRNFIEEAQEVVHASLLHESTAGSDSLRWNAQDKEFAMLVLDLEMRTRQLLEDDFKTQDVVHSLLNLATRARHYCMQTGVATLQEEAPSLGLRQALVLRRCISLMSDFLQSCGFAVSVRSVGQSGEEVGLKADKVATAAVEIRQMIRDFGATLPREHKAACFAICDTARDAVLRQAGIEVKDQKSSSTWKWV